MLKDKMISAEGAAGTAHDFTIKFEVDGEIKGSLDSWSLNDDITVQLDGKVELGELADAILGKKVLKSNKHKHIEVWLSELYLDGNVLNIRGGGRYEKRVKLLFGGWTKLFSQSGSVLLQLTVSAIKGQPVVRVVKSDVELGGLLGDVVELFDIDDSIERRIVPVVQKAIDDQIRQNVPSKVGSIENIHLSKIGFVSDESNQIGVEIAASATIKVK